MRVLLLMLLLGFSANVFAESESDLETDDSFFRSSAAPYEEDELDRLYKKSDLVKTTEQQKNAESKVKDEFSSAKTDIMDAAEARRMDDRVVAENKRRQKAILNRLAASSGPVHACVAKNAVNFQGTHATVIWMIDPDGRILDLAIKSTDIENEKIQKCIYDVAKSLNFDEAKTDLLKKSQVEYTYKFKKIVRSAPAPTLRKAPRRTASQ